MKIKTRNKQAMGMLPVSSCCAGEDDSSLQADEESMLGSRQMLQASAPHKMHGKGAYRTQDTATYKPIFKNK